jgi:uncharacterized membrane protein (DUF373 family)
MMTSKASYRSRSGNLSYYLWFERIALVFVMAMLSVIAVYAIVIAATKLVGDMRLGQAFVDKAALQDTFGLILTILIVLEFNHSVYVALTERSGAIQARILVLIAILVITRKLMLMDFAGMEAQTLLGFGGLLLALGVLYWLISDGDRHRPEIATESREPSGPSNRVP